jgi:hypothetical protein
MKSQEIMRPTGYPRNLVFGKVSWENTRVMSKPPGRRAAFISGILLVAIIAGTGILARHSIAERWYIVRLHSKVEGIRLDAARNLADLKSLAAVPHLLKAIDEDPREAYGAEIIFAGASGNGACHGAFTPMAFALYKIGPRSMPTLKWRIENCESEIDSGSSSERTNSRNSLMVLRGIVDSWERNDEAVEQPYPRSRT